jgi:hypothetical protein
MSDGEHDEAVREGQQIEHKRSPVMEVIEPAADPLKLRLPFLAVPLHGPYGYRITISCTGVN